MTSNPDQPNDELAVTSDYVPGVRGHAVLAVGADSDGREALAIWRLSAIGRAGGAWVLRFDEVERDAEQMVAVVRLLVDRCLIDWEVDAVTSILDRIGHLLPAPTVAALEGNVLAIPDLLDEIAEQRAWYDEAVERHRALSKSKIASLAWPTEVPAWKELAERTSAQPAAASPVAATALALTSAVAATAQLWEDTEQTRYRRSYLRSLGKPLPLAPRWLARLREAVASRAAMSA
ncbi:DUF6218 family protein [Verrucosispora sp. WMMD573]|uniref:DUF6218 family protein n=1 Tax=Verrucosispora sp. WMMD573 TaxID=3015149 RepID=UPI00248BF56A|nr:DUF6218 family protein [Verrucosispora sp. WMMD573]WBB52465.1 DUF6218 family protein [Verrucosispora sp. WMMD573]